MLEQKPQKSRLQQTITFANNSRIVITTAAKVVGAKVLGVGCLIVLIILLIIGLVAVILPLSIGSMNDNIMESITGESLDGTKTYLMDLSAEEAERALLSMYDKLYGLDEAYKKNLEYELITDSIRNLKKDPFVDSEIHVNLKDIKTHIDTERFSYSQDKFLNTVEHGRKVIVENVNGGGSSESSSCSIDESYQDFREIEGPHRIPWQLSSAIPAYLDEEQQDKGIMKKIFDTMLAEFKYGYPSSVEFTMPFPKNKLAGNGKRTRETPYNHTVEFTDIATVPYEGVDYEGGKGYARCDSWNQTKTVVEYQLTSSHGANTHTKTTTYDVTKVNPTLRPLQTIDAFKQINVSYVQEINPETLVSHTGPVVREWSEEHSRQVASTDEEGNVTYTTETYTVHYRSVTETWVYKSSGSAKPVVNEKDVSHKFATLINSDKKGLGIGLTNLNELLDFTSFYPAGMEVAPILARGDKIEPYIKDWVLYAEYYNTGKKYGGSGGSYSGGNAYSGDGAYIVTGEGQFHFPIALAGGSGFNLSSGFGGRTNPTKGGYQFHKGIDIAVPEGTSILAAEAGTIIICRYSSSAGNYIVIDHGNGLVTKYMHMVGFNPKVKAEFNAKGSCRVERGQEIGYVGTTGDSTGNHLHFQVEKNGKVINPLDYLMIERK